MDTRLRVAVLFGGQSGEHEVSLMSATSVIHNLDTSKYALDLIGITKAGAWKYYDGLVENISDGTWEAQARPAVFPGDPTYQGFFLMEDPRNIFPVDVVFPVLHGPRGEDGTIQGLLELSGIPYVGCGVLASSTGMDKAAAKAIFSSLNLPQGPFYTLLLEDWNKNQEQHIHEMEKVFSYPCFIKPANMGSSVGITKAHNQQELIDGVMQAGRYDRKIVVEAFIPCREIECAVLGNNHPKASILGEIVPSKEFYDYEAKYFDGGVSKLFIPADIHDEKAQEIRELAVLAYRALDCSGLARVDFFLEKETGKIYLNEINTIPGFTQISMYPKLWEATDIPYGKLLDALIELAKDSYNERHHTPAERK